jgi:Heparinase II/III-like protein/Heparinase II/III N-terminus
MRSASPVQEGAAAGTPGRVRPRQVYSPIAHLYRDPQVAADAVSGRFRYAGEALDLRMPPDWRTGGLAHDEEWHIEWSKFYFGLDLAHAYGATGEPAYLDAWQTLVSSWIDQQEPDVDTSDVTARRLQNWLYAWQGFDSAHEFPGLDTALQERLLASMSAQLDHVTAELTPERNHRTLELFALLVVSLGLPVLDPDGDRGHQAWTALQDNLLTDVWADGVHRERSTHYHLIALRSFLGARVNVTRFGGRVPPAYDERLRAACRFGLHLHRPDGQIPAWSDSDSGSYLDLLGLAADVLHDGEIRYVATRGRAGTPPAERCADFPVAGYHVQRSGWGDRGEPYPDERFLMFGCGPLGDGGHGHYDALSVEAYGLGHPLVVDPGRYTYAEGEPNWRHWFKGTAAHNTVTVDGLDQQPYRRGKPKGAKLGSRLLDRRSLDGADLLHGEVTSPAYDAVHRRAVLFVARDYWLVLDLLRGERPHDYALRWHLAYDDAPTVERLPGGITRASTPTVLLDLTGAPGSTVHVEVEPGWVSAEYGIKTPAPVVVASPDRARDVTLLTLLAPRRAGLSPRLLSADLEAGELVVELADGTTDRIRWHPDRPDAPHVALAPRAGAGTP